MFWTLNFSLTFSNLCVTPACLVVVGWLCPNPQAKITFYNIYLESLLHADLTILKLCSSSQLMTWFFSYLRHSAYCFLCLGLKIHIYCTRQQTQKFFFFFFFFFLSLRSEFHPKPSSDQQIQFQYSTFHGILFCSC